jgi:hypothetical protein
LLATPVLQLSPASGAVGVVALCCVAEEPLPEYGD